MENNGYQAINNKRTYARGGTLFGILLWAIWMVFVGLLISIQIHNEQSFSFFSDQIFTWLQVGPMLVFIFAGRSILDATELKKEQRRKDLNNMIVSLGSFCLWALVNLFCDTIQVNLMLATNMLGGILLSYIVLVIHNKAWVF
jgi:hypothetical protein